MYRVILEGIGELNKHLFNELNVIGQKLFILVVYYSRDYSYILNRPVYSKWLKEILPIHIAVVLIRAR